MQPQNSARYDHNVMHTTSKKPIWFLRWGHWFDRLMDSKLVFLVEQIIFFRVILYPGQYLTSIKIISTNFSIQKKL